MITPEDKDPSALLGEIQVDEDGNVVVGAPTATAVAVPPEEDGE